MTTGVKRGVARRTRNGREYSPARDGARASGARRRCSCRRCDIERPVPTKVALIGTGGIALANHLPGVSRCPDAAVTALCDTNPAVLAEASRASGITRTWTDPLALVRESGVDAVIIATPNSSHYPITMAAVAAGMHVLCEKPIAMSLTEALEMARAADAAGVRHMTAFTYRFVPAMRYMQRLVARGLRRRAMALPRAAVPGLGPPIPRVAAARGRRRHGRDRRHAVAPDRLWPPARRTNRTRDGLDAARLGHPRGRPGDRARVRSRGLGRVRRASSRPVRPACSRAPRSRPATAKDRAAAIAWR